MDEEINSKEIFEASSSESDVKCEKYIEADKNTRIERVECDLPAEPTVSENNEIQNQTLNIDVTDIISQTQDNTEQDDCICDAEVESSLKNTGEADFRPLDSSVNNDYIFTAENVSYLEDSVDQILQSNLNSLSFLETTDNNLNIDSIDAELKADFNSDQDNNITYSEIDESNEDTKVIACNETIDIISVGNIEDTEQYPRNDIKSTISEIERKIEERIERCVTLLKEKNASLESEVLHLAAKLNEQEIKHKKTQLEVKEKFLSEVNKLSKECNVLKKDKEAMVVRYANSEKEVLNEKKAQQDLQKKMSQLKKEQENHIFQIKNLNSDNSKLNSSFEVKLVEIGKLQTNYDKLHTELNSKEIKLRRMENKLKLEIESHLETQIRLDTTIQRLNETKEEAEQIRKHYHETVKNYQESTKLEIKQTEQEILEQEKQRESRMLLELELEELKKKQRATLEENNSLVSRIQGLEKNRLEYEQNLACLKDKQNELKQEIVDLTSRLADMETIRLQLEREKEKSTATLREVDRLRNTNAELQADMKACHAKEGELLKFTEGVTETNIKLQSSNSLLEVKTHAQDSELKQTNQQFSEMQQKYQELSAEIENAKKEHEREIQLLAKKLVEKTRNVEKLNTKLDEAENSNRVLKRRHLASVKELTRELVECKRELDSYSTNNHSSANLGSRTSSNASLDFFKPG